MTERYPDLERCLRCRAFSPPDGGEWPLYLNYTISTDTTEVLSVRGPLCSVECARVVTQRPSLWSEDYPEPPEVEA